MNCPRCMTGVLENTGYLVLKTGPLEYMPTLPNKQPAISILIWSRDDCRYIEMEAAPESLALAKRSMRDAVYAHRELPQR